MGVRMPDQAVCAWYQPRHTTSSCVLTHLLLTQLSASQTTPISVSQQIRQCETKHLPNTRSHIFCLSSLADYSKSVSASKSGSRSTSQNLGAHMRKLDLNHHTDEDASAGGATVGVLCAFCFVLHLCDRFDCLFATDRFKHHLTACFVCSLHGLSQTHISMAPVSLRSHVS